MRVAYLIRERHSRYNAGGFTPKASCKRDLLLNYALFCWQLLDDTVDVPEEGLDAEREEGVEDESGENDAEGEERGEDADADVDVDDEGEDEGEERDQHGDEEEEEGVSNSSFIGVIYFL